MKRLGLALALALWAGPALAQNVTCSTRPAGDSSNACASTAFVTTAIANSGGPGTGAVNSVTNIDSTLIVSPTSGNVVVGLNLNHANTWTATQTVLVNQNARTEFIVQNNDPGTSAVATFHAFNGANSLFVGVTGTGNTGGVIPGPRGVLSTDNVPLVITTIQDFPVIMGVGSLEVARLSNTGLRLSTITGSTQCLQVDSAGNVVGAGLPCGIAALPLSHSHIFVGTAAGVSADFGPQVTFADNGLMTFAINTGGVGSFYNVMSSTVPLNTAVIAWRLTDNVNNTVDFGLTGNGAPAPFTGTSFIRSSGNFIIDANTPSAIIFGIGLVEAGRWDQNGHLQLTYLQGGGNQCLRVNGAGVVSGIGADCGGSGGGTPGGSTTQVQYNSLGSFAGAAGVTTNGTALAIGAALTPDAPLTINMNTVANSANLIPQTIVHIVGSDTAPAHIVMDAFGVSNWTRIEGRAANGTAAAKTRVVQGQTLFQMIGRGYDGANYSVGAAGIAVEAAEDFTATANGTELVFYTIPALATQFQAQAILMASGTFAVGFGNNLSTDLGSGGLVATQLKLTGFPAETLTCVQAFDGILQPTGAACGSGGSGAVNSVSNANGTLTIAPTTGVVVASLNLAHSNTFTVPQAISNQTASSGINTFAVSQDWSASGGSNLIGSFTSYGDVSRIVLRRANGTQAAPSPVNFGDNLGGFGVRGYTTGGAFAATSSGAINIFAGETFTATAQGTYMTFNLNGVGGATPFTMNASTTGIAINATNLLPPLFADAPLTVNVNTVGTVAPQTGTVLHLVGADTTQTQIDLDSFSAGVAFYGRAAMGTGASKAVIVPQVAMVAVTGAGWDGSAYGNSGSLQIISAETFSPSGHGGFMTFRVAPLGAVAQNEMMRLSGVGLNIGNNGAGTLGVPSADTLLTVNANTTQGPAISAGVIAHFVAVDGGAGGNTNLQIDSFGSIAGILVGRANGTNAVKASLNANDAIMNLVGQGWNTGTGGYTVGGAIRIVAAEGWDASHGGAYITFRVVPSGSLTIGEVMRLQASGGLSVGTANAATDPGSGIIMGTGFRAGANVGVTCNAGLSATSRTVNGIVTTC